MIEVELSNIWGSVSLPDLLSGAYNQRPTN